MTLNEVLAAPLRGVTPVFGGDINDAYKGRITNGSLTIPKPVGTIELKLVKEGYVTKKYTLTMDTEEENSIFRFPEMTPEN